MMFLRHGVNTQKIHDKQTCFKITIILRNTFGIRTVYTALNTTATSNSLLRSLHQFAVKCLIAAVHTACKRLKYLVSIL